jgi:hypothetical protein
MNVKCVSFTQNFNTFAPIFFKINGVKYYYYYYYYLINSRHSLNKSNLKQNKKDQILQVIPTKTIHQT